MPSSIPQEAVYYIAPLVTNYVFKLMNITLYATMCVLYVLSTLSWQSNKCLSSPFLHWTLSTYYTIYWKHKQKLRSMYIVVSTSCYFDCKLWSIHASPVVYFVMIGIMLKWWSCNNINPQTIICQSFEDVHCEICT